jgi:AcrR family transcriptional regulator
VTVRKPIQRRSRQTLERLLDAAERLLEDRTFHELSVADVVAEASSSVGSFYARFPEKEALRQALLERYVHDMLEGGEAFVGRDWSGVRLADRVRALVEMQVAFCTARRGLMRMRLRYLMDASPRDDGSGVMFERLREFFAPVMHEIDTEDPDEALSFAFRLGDALLTHALLLPGPAQPGFTNLDDALVEQMTHALLAYLGVQE